MDCAHNVDHRLKFFSSVVSNSKLAAMKHQNRGIVGSLVAYERATFNRRKVPLFGSTVLSYSNSNDHSLKIE